MILPSSCRTVVLGALLVAFSAERAASDPLYAVSLSTGASAFGATVQSLSHAEAGVSLASVAGPGGLGAAVSSSVSRLFVAAARFVISDLVISGPGEGFVDGSLNLDLSGSLGMNLGPTPGSAVVGSYVQVNGALADSAFFGVVNPCVGNCGGFPPYYAAGILASVAGTVNGAAIGGTFPTPTISLPMNTPFTLSLALEVGVNAFSEGTSAFSDFLSTLTFATAGPVFNLPDGLTINSVDGGIVNNRFGSSGPDPDPDPQPVPEPASLLLLGTGMLTAAGCRRRTAAHGTTR